MSRLTTQTICTPDSVCYSMRAQPAEAVSAGCRMNFWDFYVAHPWHVLALVVAAICAREIGGCARGRQ